MDISSSDLIRLIHKTELMLYPANENIGEHTVKQNSLVLFFGNLTLLWQCWINTNIVSPIKENPI